MTLQDSLQTDESIKEEKDSLGGFQPLESAVYNFIIKLAYITFSAKKAMAFNMLLETATGQELRSQFWMTSNETKGCKNYYTNKKEEKHYLPGFNLANAVALLAGKKQIGRVVKCQLMLKWSWN